MCVGPYDFIYMCHVIQIIIVIIIIIVIVITPRPSSTFASAPRPVAAFSRPLRKGQLRTSQALTTVPVHSIDLLSRLEDADDREPDGNVQLAQV